MASQGQQGFPLWRAQPDSFEHGRRDLGDDVDHDLPAIRILQVERQVVVASATLDQFGERGYVAGQRQALHLADRPISTEGPSDDPVVVEHGDAVGRDPDVALQAVGAQLEGQLESSQGVLGGVGPGPAMSEGDRLVEERWEALLHR